MDIQTFKIQALPVREKVYRLSFRMLRNVADAEDTAQEVMLKLWTMRCQLDAYRSVEALALQICKNISINKLKARKYTSDDAFDNMQEPSPTPDRQLEAADTIATVSRIIDSLPETQRMTIPCATSKGTSRRKLPKSWAARKAR